MRVGSLFSGIGGLDLGLERAGMEVIWQVEIDPFRRRVLAQHWPDVGRHDDVRGCSGHGAEPSEAGEQQLGSVDLICSGFPCQDLSVAGRRAGLRAPRSGLFFEFARIVGEVLPDWILVENVPGLLSSNGGDDFRVVIDTLQGLGYGLSWRILDSRHFGVPQRRRRVYVVGSLGDLRSAAVLFEPEGGGGDTAAGREAGKKTARPVAPGPHGYRFDYLEAEDYIIETAHQGANQDGWRTGATYPVSATQAVCAPADPDGVREATGVPRRVDAQLRAFGKRTRAHTTESADETWGETETANPVTADHRPMTLAAPLEAADGHHGRSSPRGDGADNLVATPLRSRSSAAGVSTPGRGGEDDWNLVADAQRATCEARPCCPDGPRYAALGDAVTVGVAEWIGRRIMEAK